MFGKVVVSIVTYLFQWMYVYVVGRLVSDWCVKRLCG